MDGPAHTSNRFTGSMPWLMMYACSSQQMTNAMRVSTPMPATRCSASAW